MKRARELHEGAIKLFVGSLPKDISEFEVRRIFAPFGEVNDVRLPALNSSFKTYRCWSVLAHPSHPHADG